MITIDDKLYITNEVNLVLIKYAKTKVLRDLLHLFSFGELTNTNHVTELIENVSYYNGDLPPQDSQYEMISLINEYLQSLQKENMAALNFWMINENYQLYLEDSAIVGDQMTLEEFNQQFGRELAFKLYEPGQNGLNDELLDRLQMYLRDFASELDLSLVDDHTLEHILEVIDKYCGN